MKITNNNYLFNIYNNSILVGVIHSSHAKIIPQNILAINYRLDFKGRYTVSQNKN